MSPLDALLALHAEVDREAAGTAAKHPGRLQCRRGCAACCVDGITVFEVEAGRIRRNAPEVLMQPPHPEGACAFLDAEAACRIYADRPYVCRTQGLPLRWLEERGDDVVEMRDICPLNEAGTPLEELDPADCWSIGPYEERLQAIAAAFDPGMRRVTLRSLLRTG
ncbi:MAG TPA: YkgJ family cysteine cluster protein [Candidatus Polarisedimenticolaceae bacterium]